MRVLRKRKISKTVSKFILLTSTPTRLLYVDVGAAPGIAFLPFLLRLLEFAYDVFNDLLEFLVVFLVDFSVDGDSFHHFDILMYSLHTCVYE